MPTISQHFMLSIWFILSASQISTRGEGCPGETESASTKHSLVIDPDYKMRPVVLRWDLHHVTSVSLNIPCDESGMVLFRKD